MEKPNLIVHETYKGKQRTEDIFAAVFLSTVTGLTKASNSDIIKQTEQSQDSLCSKEGETNGTSEE